ncbi:hypothetical protein SUGI_0666020 [Cryptomeria japonica]|nr:hypothetical protein SUGI_0666020 [Cryptomeria japonica]
MPSRRLEHPTRIEILRQAMINDEPLDEADRGPDRGAMVPDRAPWSPIRAWRGVSGLAHDVQQFALAILMIEY